LAACLTDKWLKTARQLVLTREPLAATLRRMVRDRDASAPAPFSGAVHPATFHTTAAHDEALARLEWLVGQRQRCGLVVAEAGMGKSHLAVAAARRLGGLGAEVAVISLAGLPDGEWLELLLDRLPLDAASRAEPLRPWLKLENRLRENTLLGRATVLACDDIDRGPADARAGLARLVAAAEPRFGTTVVVATAAPAGLARVPDAIRQRTAVRIDLPPWSDADVADYLAAGLARAGRSPELFSAAAAATIRRFAAGVPAVIRRLAHLSLAAADAEGLALVEAATIEEIWRELSPPETLAPDAAAEEPLAEPRFKAVRRLWG
jgi:type II secretory pathway predicted ATPase ExeA